MGKTSPVVPRWLPKHQREFKKTSWRISNLIEIDESHSLMSVLQEKSKTRALSKIISVRLRELQTKCYVKLGHSSGRIAAETLCRLAFRYVKKIDGTANW